MTLEKEKHVAYLRGLTKRKDFFSDGEHVAEHLSVPGAYWCLSALGLLGERIPDEQRVELLTWLESCRNSDGGWGGGKGFDSGVLPTLYAMLVLNILGEKKEMEAEKGESIAAYVLSLYDKETGGFKGDSLGEVDGRTTYSGLFCLYLLGKPLPENSGEYFERCWNFDGGFGGKAGAESHAAYAFCALSGLNLLRRSAKRQKCIRFLALRQCASGGFNGRPEKLADVCYSWWVLSSLAILGGLSSIDAARLEGFVLACQSPKGGFADRPGNSPDVFHTFFALAALALLDAKKFGLEDVDPAFSLPKGIVGNKDEPLLLEDDG